MTDRFTGDWLVTEYVHNADGTFAGLVHQRRSLQPSGENRFVVRQSCRVSDQLVATGHPMAAFAGEWEFSLHRDGRLRHYHGPDVVGRGLSLGQQVIMGRGRWPRFGYNFTSFGISTGAERQITGGVFYDSDPAQPIARIVGIGVAEREGQPDYPHLPMQPIPSAGWAGYTAQRWHFGPDGEELPVNETALPGGEQTSIAYGCAVYAANGAISVLMLWDAPQGTIYRLSESAVGYTFEKLTSLHADFERTDPL